LFGTNLIVSNYDRIVEFKLSVYELSQRGLSKKRSSEENDESDSRLKVLICTIPGFYFAILSLIVIAAWPRLSKQKLGKKTKKICDASSDDTWSSERFCTSSAQTEI